MIRGRTAAMPVMTIPWILRVLTRAMPIMARSQPGHLIRLACAKGHIMPIANQFPRDGAADIAGADDGDAHVTFALLHSLKNLRDNFGAAMVPRRPHGMEPTATALALGAPDASPSALRALLPALAAVAASRALVRLPAQLARAFAPRFRPHHR